MPEVVVYLAEGRSLDQKRGLVKEGEHLSDEDTDQLIFAPGFSTAEKVTDLSGRGVGMDVVRRNIEALRGSVTVHSVPRQGSRIEIRLPLTLAIIDGFLVSVGSSKFILPLDAVVEVIESHPTHAPADAAGSPFAACRSGCRHKIRNIQTVTAMPKARNHALIKTGGNEATARKPLPK